MGTGIVICGLNGVGKSTLGKALAEELDFCFIDNEDLYFPKNDSDYLYTSPRTHKKLKRFLKMCSTHMKTLYLLLCVVIMAQIHSEEDR